MRALNSILVQLITVYKSNIADLNVMRFKDSGAGSKGADGLAIKECQANVWLYS